MSLGKNPSKPQPNDTKVADLKAVTAELQSGGSRETEAYRATIEPLVKMINGLGRGSLTDINTDELIAQIGHLLYFHVREANAPIPFDIEFLNQIWSHFKNPTLLVLKRIRKLLMTYHRKILAHHEAEQAQERRLAFYELDISSATKHSIEEMQRFQVEAQLSSSVSRKLDILTQALHVPAQYQMTFRVLERILVDPFHLRHNAAMEWFNNSPLRGDLPLLQKMVKTGLELINRKTEEVFSEMEKWTGIRYDRDLSSLDPGFSWFSLGPAMERGGDFVRSFEEEALVDQALKRLTFFTVRSQWRAEFFIDAFEKYKPTPRNRQEACGNLIRLYQELEIKIQGSSSSSGDVQAAIESDLTYGLLSPEEGKEARHWVNTNKAQLQQLKLDVFKTLEEQFTLFPNLVFPESMVQLFGGSDQPGGNNLPKFQILDLNRKLEQFETRMDAPDNAILEDLIDLLKQIKARQELLYNIDFQRTLRSSCKSFAEYEEKLGEYEKADSRLDLMHQRVSEWILETWHHVMYADIKPEVLEEAFAVVMDQMLHSLKRLDYEAINAQQLEVYLNAALMLPDQTALFQLDQLLHEIHSIPKQNQILAALSDWESTLSRSEFESKQGFVLENELKLQALVDRVRTELRERIGAVKIRPRRLRFEVFSLADCYADNLRSLLRALLRMAPQLTSPKEAERLIASLQAIEVQTIEAQRITKPNGEAYQKLNQLKGKNLLPQTVVEDLFTDLEANFTDLDQLLKETNAGLESVRQFQNRFGGDFDSQHLTVIINIHDLERLKETYHFVDTITMMDIKRFGVIYKQKTALMDELFERANRRDPSIPAPILKLIDPKVYKAYRQNFSVPIPLKAAIFREMPDILEFECELLIRTLNLVSAKEVRNKSVYKGLLLMMGLAKGTNYDGRRALRRIWLKMRTAMTTYVPKNLKANYDHNVRALLTDVGETVGSLFEDL